MVNRVDRGLVGSTSNILHSLKGSSSSSGGGGDDVGGGVCRVEDDMLVTVETTTTTTTMTAKKEQLKFILGTEAGMVTSIVRSVQDILDANSCRTVEVEIIFPVSLEAVMVGDDTLKVVPGVAGGDGCSTLGGCATCPYMKMNDIDSVHDIVNMIGRQRLSVSGSSSSSSMTTIIASGVGTTNTITPTTTTLREELQLTKHLPPNRLAGKIIDGRQAIDLGTEPIMYIRAFMRDGRLSDELVDRFEHLARA